MKSHRNTKRVFSVFLLGLILVMIIVLISRTFMDFSRPRKSQMQRIRDRGYLLAATDKNSLNYFIYRGEAMGYQLELLNDLARRLQVPMKILVANDVQDLYKLLNYHAVDLIALNLPVTLYGKRLGNFTRPFGDTRLVLVQPRDHPVTSLRELDNDTVYIQRNPFMTPLYRRFLEEARGHAILKAVPENNQLELVKMVAEGKIRYTLCEENLAMVLKRTWLNIDASLVIGSLFPYAWALHTGSDSLSRLVNNWVDSIRADHTLKQIYLSYFANVKTSSYLRSYFSTINVDRISPYDRQLKRLSRMIWWDWRLIASQMYEESNFITGQVSSHLATGLMQLIPETADKMGLDSTAGPYGQIAAGIRYLRWIDQQLPDSISDPGERVCFILAAYNIGIGRVMALREKARRYGKDPNRWNGNVEYYLLRQSREDPYDRKARETVNDFPVDYNTEGYVGGIISRFYHYRNLVSR